MEKDKSFHLPKCPVMADKELQSNTGNVFTD
jgi:hypothetical protein